MKQEKVVSMILAVINVLLVFVGGILYFRSDRTEPRFIIQPAEITYRPDLEESFLYEGIAAHDDRDGDLTDKIVIEKKVENQAEGSVIIYYAVSDAAGNVAKFSKLFSAEYPVEAQAASEEPVMRQLELDQTAQGRTAEKEIDLDVRSGNEPGRNGGTDQEKDDTENEAARFEGDEGAETGNSGEAVEAANEKADRNEEEAGDGHEDALDHGNGDAQTVSEAAPSAWDSGAPELVFRDTEVTIDAGSNVPWTEMISTLRDDQDDYATLYYNLQVSPYNRSKPGTYPVMVHTEDSDGNRSQTVLVTITVR